MQKHLKALCIIVCIVGSCILFSACTIFNKKQTSDSHLSVVTIVGGGVFHLLAPHTLPYTVVVTQRIRGAFKEREFVIFSQVEVDGDHLAMVGVSPSGNTLFSLNYVDEQITVEKSQWLPDSLQPAAVLADLQMIFWPISQLKQPLESAGLDIVESVVDTKRQRRILNGNKILIEIVYDTHELWQGQVTFENKYWNYSYIIDTVKVDS